jgi:hypothetical protein
MTGFLQLAVISSEPLLGLRSIYFTTVFLFGESMGEITSSNRSHFATTPSRQYNFASYLIKEVTSSFHHLQPAINIARFLKEIQIASNVATNIATYKVH